jgi:ribosome biogenesis GTPase
VNESGVRATGLVVGVHRRRYAVELDDGTSLDCVLKGRAMAPVCGDRVDVASASAGAAIVAIEPRRSLFYRSDAFREKLIAANVTQVVGVVAPDVAADENLLNRWIVAAETEHCRFVLAQNKADLPDTRAFAARLAQYAALGYPVVAISAHGDISPLAQWIAGQHTVLIGQSGVGKSTLVNALVPQAAARIGVVSEALRGGRHTTTSTTLHRLPEGDGWIVDSPGMKVFGLAHCAPETLASAFVELRDLASTCRFSDCRHDREPGCAVQAAVAAGTVAPQRVALLRALVNEAEKARDPAR